MNKNIDNLDNNDDDGGVFPAHPEPKGATYTDDDDDDEEEEDEKEKNSTINLIDYFEIIMMTSPVAGVKMYLHKTKGTDNHVLIIRNPTPEKAHLEEEKKEEVLQ